MGSGHRLVSPVGLHVNCSEEPQALGCEGPFESMNFIIYYNKTVIVKRKRNIHLLNVGAVLKNIHNCLKPPLNLPSLDFLQTRAKMTDYGRLIPKVDVRIRRRPFKPDMIEICKKVFKNLEGEAFECYNHFHKCFKYVNI